MTNVPTKSISMVWVSTVFAELLQNISTISEAEITAIAAGLPVVKDGEYPSDELDTPTQQLYTFWQKKMKETDEVVKNGDDLELANKLLNEVRVLYAMLDYIAWTKKFPNELKFVEANWTVRKGFIFVFYVEDEEEMEIDVELEEDDEDEGENGEDEKPVRKNPDRKKLH